MVEMAMILPLLLTMLFGVIEFGRLFVEWQIVQSSARSGARSAALYRAECNPSVVLNEVSATVSAVIGANPMTQSKALEVDVANACSTQASQLCCVTVRLHTDLGILSDVAEVISGDPTLVLTSTAVMRPEAAIGIVEGTASCAGGFP
jgi:Flp pilus assembly protein TadG